MAINTLRYRHQGSIRWGVLHADRVIPVPGNFATTGDFVSQVAIADLRQLSGDALALSEVEVLSPVTGNQQFICQGANYRQHMIESGMDPDAKHFNMIFTKAPSCIVPASSDLVKPARVRFLDYEIELGLVLRREVTAKVDVHAGNLHEFVAGLVIVNDYSARDIQIPEMQFYKGKSFRTFGPVGPWLSLLEPEDMPLLDNLDLHLTVNGETRQQDNTGNLVHKPAPTLTELSGIQDFFPGDLLATGTPSGCALSIPSPLKQRVGAMLPEAMKWSVFLKVQAKRTQYLQTGDIVEASIRSADGRIDLGRQRNRVVAEQ